MTPFEALDPLRGPLPELPTSRAVSRDLPDGRQEQKPGDVHDALMALAEAWKAYEENHESDAGQAVLEAVHRCEMIGIKVDPKYAAAVAGVDLDAAPEKKEPVNRPLPEQDTDDPLVLRPGMVPIYNPCDWEIHLRYGGETWRVPPGAVAFADRRAADQAVGPDNAGGAMSRFGVRRLYGPEPRFEPLAAKAGRALLEWVQERNLGVMALADKTYAGSREKALHDEQRVALEKNRLEDLE